MVVCLAPTVCFSDDEENATTSDDEAPEEVSSKAPSNVPLWHDPDDQAFEKDVRKKCV